MVCRGCSANFILALTLFPLMTTVSTRVGQPTINHRHSRGLNGAASLESLWNISPPTLDVLEYEGLNFTLNFGISDSILDIEQVRADMYDATCNIPYTGSGLILQVDPLYDDGPEAFDKQTAPALISINANEIRSDSQVYIENVAASGKASAQVKFCVHFALYTPPWNGFDGFKVNYLEVIIILDIQLTDNYELEGFTVKTVRTPPTSEAEIDSYQIEGFFCDEDNNRINQVDVRQGLLIKICARPDERARSEDVFMRGWQSFSFFGVDGFEQRAVANYRSAQNGLTELYCPRGANVCWFKTLLVSGLFIEGAEILGVGTVDLQYGTTGASRRELMETRRNGTHAESSSVSTSAALQLPAIQERELQQESNRVGGVFELKFKVIPADLLYGTSAARGTSNLMAASLGLLIFTSFILFLR